EVVDLAVEDDRHRAVLVEQRLLAGGEVDDGQAPVRERDARLEVVATFVRAAMVLDVVHALHEGTVEVALAAGVEEAGDATHDRMSSLSGAVWAQLLFVETGVTRHHVVDAEIAFNALAACGAVALPQRSIGSVAQ